MAKENLLYSKDHEWVLSAGGAVTIGVTDYAQHELGDVVFVDLPAAGKQLKKGDPAANIESVKAVSDVYAPVTGAITEVNAKLGANPELVNQDPFGEGWIFKMSVNQASELEELMDLKKYEEYLKGIAGE
ncbi:MAG: glycine cleavage system protein GcvH [Acidobacteria bacterium]|jgi:glycine cleavage system H protein|nr:glycine cleavage system protein GcvH [Acidobacteriota bacterium]